MTGTRLELSSDKGPINELPKPQAAGSFAHFRRMRVPPPSTTARDARSEGRRSTDELDLDRSMQPRADGAGEPFYKDFIDEPYELKIKAVGPAHASSATWFDEWRARPAPAHHRACPRTKRRGQAVLKIPFHVRSGANRPTERQGADPTPETWRTLVWPNAHEPALAGGDRSGEHRMIVFVHGLPTLPDNLAR
jgi:hypothetical protein